MKKQILILAMFTLAIMFAGNTKVYAQDLTTSEFGTAPIPLTQCVGTPEQPKAGEPYTYSFDGATAATDFRWWATKDPNFVDHNPTAFNQSTDSLQVSTGELTSVSASYWTQTTTNGVDIVWSADILGRTNYQQGAIGAGTPAAPTSTFVVGWGTDGCTDNIKVWEIDPSPSFTVDIKNIDPATEQPTLAYGDAVTQCVDEVRGAIYNTTNFDVDYNFGWDTLYYEVVAANFVTSWLPTFFLTGLDGTTIQTAEIGWAATFADAQAGNFVEPAAIDITAGTAAGTVPLTTTLTDNSVGVSAYVRVVVSNHNYETLAASTYTLSVAGEDANGFDIDDDAACTIPGSAADAADDDITTRTVTERPTLQEGVPIILPVGGEATINP